MTQEDFKNLVTKTCKLLKLEIWNIYYDIKLKWIRVLAKNRIISFYWTIARHEPSQLPFGGIRPYCI